MSIRIKHEHHCYWNLINFSCRLYLWKCMNASIHWMHFIRVLWPHENWHLSNVQMHTCVNTTKMAVIFLIRVQFHCEHIGPIRYALKKDGINFRLNLWQFWCQLSSVFEETIWPGNTTYKLLPAPDLGQIWTQSKGYAG